MRIILVAVAALLALSGCANNPIDPSVTAESYRPLRCADKKQCDLFWQRAQLWVSENSGYKIQTATDVIIQTYGPFGAKVELAHKILRISDENGAAQITIASACDNFLGCHPHRDVAAVSFKRFVAGATWGRPATSGYPATATGEFASVQPTLAPESEKVLQARTFGESSFQVEKIARKSRCEPVSPAILISKTTATETYQVSCEGGNQALFKCEMRQCRMMN